MNCKTLVKLIILLLITSGCNTTDNYKNDLNFNTMINKSEFNSLYGKRVYFGHQSVGNNIISGLNSIIIKNNNLNFIKIVTFKEYLSLKIPENDSSFYFIHSLIGKNDYPESKIEDFQHKLDTLKHIDAAFLKFCFVDINRNTDIPVLYKNYINKMRTLEKKFKETKFIYITVPPTVKRNYVVKLAKIILGRPDVSFKRNQFNKLIRETPNINLFDLAYLESHLENDTEEIGSGYLLKIYASDTGHLNSIGSEKVALHLLTYLNDMFEKE